jgi:hypothetical protein
VHLLREFSGELFPSPFELEGSGPVGEAGYMAGTNPSLALEDLGACSVGATLDFLVVLAEAAVQVDSGAYISCIASAEQEIYIRHYIVYYVYIFNIKRKMYI